MLSAIPIEGGAEVTVECNPDDVTVELLTDVRRGGRQPGEHRCAVDGRPRARFARAERTTSATSRRPWRPSARCGLPTFNLDVIYGAAGERLSDWRTTVESILALDPPHVSAYALTIEAGTPLAAQPDRHPDDDDQADKYELVDAALTAAGLENYEVSNWARRGHECRHNLVYWRQQDYIGFGCAAHSHRAGRRWWNVRTPDRYIELVEQHAVDRGVRRDARRRRPGGSRGCSWRCGCATACPTTPSTATSSTAWSTGSADRWVLTRSGRLLANEISMRLH